MGSAGCSFYEGHSALDPARESRLLSDGKETMIGVLSKLTACLALLLALQVTSAFFAKRTIRPSAGPTKVAVGSEISVPVIADSGGPPRALSDQSPNSCRYFVIASLTCPYSAGAARRWTALARHSPGGLQVPAGWSIGWVVGEGASGRGVLFAEDFPVSTFHGLGEFADFTSVGVVGVPYFIVLDRSGRVVESGLSGELPPYLAFQTDCSLDRSKLRPAPIGN